MLNPSYLIRSRHAIFYFRYPLPQYGNKRVSISLKTRCPKEALRLSKALEYHAFMVMSNPDIQSLDYAEVKELLRNHFAEVLKKQKAKIDKDGAMSQDVVKRWRDLHEEVEETIAAGDDEIGGFMFDSDVDIPEELRLDTKLKPIAERHGISLDEDSKERRALRKEYKHAFKGYIEALLAYNEGAGYYDYAVPVASMSEDDPLNSKFKLGNVITQYLDDDKNKDRRGYRDKRDCLNYLLEVFGEDYSIRDIDYPEVSQVTDMLIGTPTNRSKKPQTRELNLVEQIAVADEMDMEVFADTNVNKYLRYMRSLFAWAMKRKLISNNPFVGSAIKEDKNKVRRRNFDKREVGHILKAVSELDTKDALGKARYWATLLYVYTGARLNEIASLTPDDIIQDGENDIHYIRITDEEESKKVKSKAGRRFVPVHSHLIELGFLDYVQHARDVIAKKPETDGYPTRLLYALTFKDDVWGRKIGRWFNSTWLKDLGLKEKVTSLHSLRHSFITYLDVAGVDFSTIASMAGHEQGTVTAKHYIHYGVEHLPRFREAVEKLPY